MPATPIQPLITDAGLAAAIAAQGTGLTLQITHVQIGKGAYALNFAEGSADYQRTALVAPVEKNVIAGGYRDGTRFRVDVLFEPWTGAPATWGITEIGFWAGDPDAGGKLFAIWAQPTVFAQRNMLTYLATFNMLLKRVDPAAVSVVIDPDLALALALVADHEAAADPHPQYMTVPEVQSSRTGDIVFIPASVPKPGTLKLNGTLLSRASYPELWAYAQTSGNMAANDGAWTSGQFSPGDGITTFRIPDWRGYVPRAWDDGRGIDTGRAIGTTQADQLLQHNHGVNDPGHNHSINNPAHNHGLNDPGHGHAYTNPRLPGEAAGDGSSYQNGPQTYHWRAEDIVTGTTGSSATNVSLNAATTAISANSTTTGITTQNSSGGTEVRVKNVASLAVIYY